MQEAIARFQMRNILFALFILLVPILYSCTTSTHSLSKDDVFISSKARMTGWKKIVILPFSGDPVSRRVSAELFSYYLEEQPYFEVLGPAISEIELKKRDIVIAGTAPSNKDILHMAEILGADAVLAGSVSIKAGWGAPYFNKQTGAILFDVKTGAILFDVKTGEIIAQDEEVITGGSGISASISEKAKKAIKLSAHEMLTVLYELAGDPRKFQIRKEEESIDTDEGEFY